MGRNKKDWWFQFRPERWMADSELRRCSKRARATWLDMICLMHDCDPPGKFMTGGRPWPLDDIASALAGDFLDNQKDIKELLEKGAASLDENGAVTCRMMFQNWELSQKRKNAGSMGGNPKLLNQNEQTSLSTTSTKPLVVVVDSSSSISKGVQGETEAPHPPDINALVPDDLLALCSEWKGRSLGSTQMCELAERVQKHGAALVEKAIRLHLANGNALGNWKYLDKVIEGGARERKAGSLDGIDWKKVFA